MGAHLIDGEFQSDKYPTTPRGKVPLSVKDKTAQDLLWEYAQRRRAVDAEFSDDLETALRSAGYEPSAASQAAAQAWRPMSEADETEDVEIIAFNLRHKTVSRYRWQEKSIRAGQHLLEVEVGWSEIRGCTIIRREYQDDYVWVPVPSPLPQPPEPQG